MLQLYIFVDSACNLYQPSYYTIQLVHRLQSLSTKLLLCRLSNLKAVVIAISYVTTIHLADSDCAISQVTILHSLSIAIVNVTSQVTILESLFIAIVMAICQVTTIFILSIAILAAFSYVNSI